MMATRKQATKKPEEPKELPKTIRVFDQTGQPYDIDNRSKLWTDALLRLSRGEELIYSIKDITAALEWGWWTCFEAQQKWVQSCGVPMPSHQMLFGLEDAQPQQLREKLREFGGYVSWLESQLGVMEGRAHALKQGYDAAVLIRSADSETKSATEKSKEANAIAKSETLRQTKRMQIEQETLIATVKGMLKGYAKAWETVSRVITTRMAEEEMATGRHA